MDRFIALNPDDPSLPVYNLKSNMDRFIVRDKLICMLMLD